MNSSTLDRRIFVGALLAAGFAISPVAAAAADGWPARPVRLVVPFPPAGGADYIGRLLSQRLGETWGQTMIVDNRPGAGTMIGSDAVAKSPPDGYTLLLAVSNHTSNPALFAKMPYDTVKDFTPVTLVGSAPMVLVVTPGLPVKNLTELLALLREQPGRLSYSSAGNGSVGHLAGELLKQSARVDMVHVAYKGTAPAELDLMAGQVQLMFTGLVTAAPQIRSGKMKAIAIGSLTRSAVLPEVPTLNESGLPGFESSIWYGLLGPAGLPPPIVARVQTDVAKMLQEADVKAKLLSQGIEASGSTAEQFKARIATEIPKFHKLVKSAGIKSE